MTVPVKTQEGTTLAGVVQRWHLSMVMSLRILFVSQTDVPSCNALMQQMWLLQHIIAKQQFNWNIDAYYASTLWHIKSEYIVIMYAQIITVFPCFFRIYG